MPRLEYGLEIDDMATVWALTGDPLPPEDPSINLPRTGGFDPVHVASGRPASS